MVSVKDTLKKLVDKNSKLLDLDKVRADNLKKFNEAARKAGQAVKNP